MKTSLEDLSKLLVCPISHNSLIHIPKAEAHQLLAKQVGIGTVVSISAQNSERLSSAFITADGKFLYPIFDDIIFIRPEDAIKLY